MREQLWRYYPQMLELADDLGLILDLWNRVGALFDAMKANFSRSRSLGISILAHFGRDAFETL